MKKKLENKKAILSIGICAALIFIGLVRMLSYSQGATGDFVRNSIFGFLCYNPDSLASAQYFKILATPSVVALIYFFFRWRNAGVPSYLGSEKFEHARRIDFKSPVLRLILTTVVTVHWIGMEWWKFNVEGFYPWSVLENRGLNIAVLIASQAIAFWGMKYLSFDPVRIRPQKLGNETTEESPV